MADKRTNEKDSEDELRTEDFEWNKEPQEEEDEEVVEGAEEELEEIEELESLREEQEEPIESKTGKSQTMKLALTALVMFLGLGVFGYYQMTKEPNPLAEEEKLEKKIAKEKQKELEEVKANFEYDLVMGDAEILEYIGDTESVKIPETIEDLPVTVIKTHAFKDADIKHIYLPENLEVIESEAFYNTSLEQISIPPNVREIGTKAFAKGKLEYVSFRGTLHEIEESVFEDNYITAVDFPDYLQEIKANAFKNNLISDLYFPDTLKIIGASAFEYNRLEVLTVPDNVLVIGDKAFYDNKVNSIRMSPTKEHMGKCIFSREHVRNTSQGFIENDLWNKIMCQ